MIGRCVELALDGEIAANEKVTERQTEDRPRSRYSRQGLQSLHCFLLKSNHLSGSLIARLRKLEIHAENVPGLKSRVRLRQFEEAANQQSGAREQYNSQRDFGYDQNISEPPFFERSGGMLTPGLEGSVPPCCRSATMRSAGTTRRKLTLSRLTKRSASSVT